MKHTSRFRHRKRLKKRHQSLRRMEFYGENLAPDILQKHVGAWCHLPKSFKKQA